MIIIYVTSKKFFKDIITNRNLNEGYKIVPPLRSSNIRCVDIISGIRYRTKMNSKYNFKLTVNMEFALDSLCN